MNVEHCLVKFARDNPEASFDYALIECMQDDYEKAREICAFSYEGQPYYRFICMPFRQRGWCVKFIVDDVIVERIEI